MAGSTLGEQELILTLPANSTNNLVASFNQDTVVVTTFYIQNLSDLPTGSTQTITVNMIDWQFGNSNIMELDSYRFGKYIENYPIQTMYMNNNFNVDVQVYIQYVIKVYEPYYSPVIQDITSLQLQQNILGAGLTAGCNFRYYGPISTFYLDGSPTLPIGSTLYILDQQVIGTDVSNAGSVTVQWIVQYAENIPVSALGASEDSNTYIFTVDVDTLAIPGSGVTSTYATMNWIKVDYFSPLEIDPTQSNSAIIFDSGSGMFTCAGYLSVTAFSEYLDFVNAPFTQIIIE